MTVAQISKTMELILFADDTNIFMSDKCFDSLINKINTELHVYPNGLKSTNYPLILKNSTLCYFAINGLEK